MTVETHKFDVEVEPLMSMIVNSLYKSKDNSIRELISNASDAIDKYLSDFISESDEPKTAFDDLRIQIKVLKEERRIEITDTGIGMTRKDLEDFLGKIASSGTRKFKEAMAEKGGAEDLKMIGQFGLGFYAAFIISSRVDVITKAPGHEQFKWSSTGTKDYTIEKVESDRNHGTTIVLTVKEGEEEFLDNKKIEDIVKKNNGFITYPIFLEEYIESIEETENKTEDLKIVEVKDEETENAENENVENPENNKTAEKKMTFNLKKINNEKPLWLKTPNSCSAEEYTNFYKAISADHEEHLAVKHSSIEGAHKFDFLLYAPKRAKYNIFDKASNNNKSSIKLYCAKVLLTENLTEIIPEWMNFIVGIISNEDLPINISREFIQGNSTFKVMKRILIRKSIELISEIMVSDKSEDFYKEFSDYIKVGVREEDSGNRAKLAEFLRYSTTKSEKPISLSEYCSRMKENQKQILVITGTSMEKLRASPFLKAYKDYEVIFMPSTIDEVMLQSFNKYGETPIQRIDTDGVDLKFEMNEELKKEFESLGDKLKVLLDLEKVEVKDLGDVPALVSTSKYGYSPAMRNIIKSQPGAANNPMVMMMSMSKNVLTISPSSSYIQNLKALSEIESEKEKFENLAKVIYSVSLLDSGFEVPESFNFSKLIYNLL